MVYNGGNHPCFSPFGTTGVNPMFILLTKQLSKSACRSVGWLKKLE